MRSALAAAVISMGLLATGASADHKHDRASDHSVSRKDPKDVENKLDIKRVAFRGHGDGSATLVMKTRKKWGCKYLTGTALDDGGTAYVRWMVDKNRDPYVEREAYFGCTEDGWSLSWGAEKSFVARRPNRRTLKVRLPLDDLGLDKKTHLQFTAVTLANGVFDDDVYIEETDAATPLVPLADRAES